MTSNPTPQPTPERAQPVCSVCEYPIERNSKGDDWRHELPEGRLYSVHKIEFPDCFNKPVPSVASPLSESGATEGNTAFEKWLHSYKQLPIGDLGYQWHQAAKMMHDAWKAGQSAQWMAIAEPGTGGAGLPELGAAVFVQLPKSGPPFFMAPRVTIGWLSVRGWRAFGVDGDSFPTHWMPLPDPPAIHLKPSNPAPTSEADKAAN